MNYKKKYLKYKKKYLKLKNFIELKALKGGMNIEAKEFIPKKKMVKEKKSIFSEKQELVVVTHNLGGQTRYMDINNKSYLNCGRGEIVLDNKKKYRTIEELNENIPPPELNEDADIYLFQEWQTQEKSGKRLNDLVIQTQNGTSLYGKNRYLDYFGMYIIDTTGEKKAENIIIKNVHLPIVSETSSLTQIEKLIKILEEILDEIKQNKKVIIGGDFNFDFNNIENEFNSKNGNMKKILENSKKPDVKKQAKELEEKLKNLYSEFNLENFMIFPIKEDNIRTNVWAIPIEGELTEKCVDYIMVSRNLEEYISKSSFEIDESFIGASYGEEAEFLKNDYDHIRLKLKMVMKKRYKIGYLN